MPLEKLEPFVGHLTVISVERKGLDSEKHRDAYWPNWKVVARTDRVGGSESKVEMDFEPYRGDLFALYVEPQKSK